jgi:hypothetical protein
LFGKQLTSRSVALIAVWHGDLPIHRY